MKCAVLSLGSSWRSVIGALVATCIAVACGGGVDTGGTGAPATSFSTGRISGFGSVIVNGVRFDDSSANIVDDDGVAHASGDLKLGMVIDVDAGQVTTDAATGARAGVATQIHFGTDVQGPVQSVDAAGGSLVVLGQTVQIDADTVFGGVTNGLNDMRVGDLLSVFAFFDANTGVYTATRMELKTNLDAYKLRGVVANLNTAAKTFAMGNADISYAGIAAGNLPALANGVVARVELEASQQAGLWVATRLRTARPVVSNGAGAQVEGFITDFVSPASFKVDGIAVDASASGVVFENGSVGQLANGVRIEVEGSMQGGAMTAQRVEVKNPGGAKQVFELHGAIGSVDAAQSSFVLRGITVTYNADTRFNHGTAADLAAGAQVQVNGVLANNGTELFADIISFGR